MAPVLIPLVLVALGLGCIIIGIQGVRGGHRVAAKKGPESLMHFPARLPWLKRKVTAARWVTWVGRLYLMAGIVCVTGASLILSGDSAQETNTNCARLAETAFSTFPIALQGGRIESSEPASQCTHRVFDQGNIRWFTISSVASGYAPKNDFLETRRNLSRLAYTIQPIDELGSRAVLATPKPGSSLNPVILFNTSEGQHRIEINARKANEAKIVRLIKALQGTLHTQWRRSL